MAEHQFTPVGTVFEEAVSLLNCCELLPKLIAVELSVLLTPDSSALQPEVSSLVAALESKGIRVAAVGQAVQPAITLGLLHELGLDKVAAESVVLQQCGNDSVVPANATATATVVATAAASTGAQTVGVSYGALAKELRRKSGVPVSSTGIVCASAAAAKAAARGGGGMASVVVSRPGGGLDLAALRRLLGGFAASALEDRGF